MGSFASGVFSAMLSWIRGAVAYLWGAASTAEGGGLIRWLGENWLIAAVILCAAGMAVDFVVNLLRWQPHKVWASFFRRLFGRRTAEQPTRRTVRRRVIYADGTARTETVEHEEPEEPEPLWQEPPVYQDDRFDQEAYRRQFARPGSQEAPTAGLEDYPQPVQAQVEPAVEPAEAVEAPQPVQRSRRVTRESTRAAFQQLFAGHDEDELDLRYKPAQPAISKEEAYNKPYIPPQWKPPAEAVRGDRDAGEEP